MKYEKWVCAVGTTLVLTAITLQTSFAAGEIVHPTLIASAQAEEKSHLLENHHFNLGNRDGFREYKGMKPKHIYSQAWSTAGVPMCRRADYAEGGLGCLY